MDSIQIYFEVAFLHLVANNSTNFSDECFCGTCTVYNILTQLYR